MSGWKRSNRLRLPQFQGSEEQSTNNKIIEADKYRLDRKTEYYRDGKE